MPVGRTRRGARSCSRSPTACSRILSAVEMLTLAQPRAMRSVNCSGVMPVPPWSATGMPVASTMSVTRWLSSCGAARYMPCALPMAGAKTSTPVVRMKSSAVSSDCSRSDPPRRDVLDPLEALDLALDQRAVGLASATTSMRLAGVLLDAQLRAVEQDRVPALREAQADHRPVRAVVEVERDRHGDALGHRRPHGEQHVGARPPSRSSPRSARSAARGAPRPPPARPPSSGR